MVNLVLVLVIAYAAGYLQAIFIHAPKTWARIMEVVLKLQDLANKKKRQKEEKEPETDQDGYIKLPPT